MFPYIYKLILQQDTDSFIKGQIYIGKSASGRVSYKGSGIIPVNLMSKYGKDVFKKEIIVEGDFNKELLNDLERHYIQLYASQLKGLNRSPGGDGRPDIPKKIYQYSLSGVFLKEHFDENSAIDFIGGSKSSLMNSANSNNRHKTHKGYQWLYEKHDKIEPYYSYRKVEVHQYKLTGEFVKSFISIKEAGLVFKEDGFKNINQVLREKTNTAFGFQWKKYKVDNCGKVITKHKRKGVICFELNGNEVGRFDSSIDAGKFINKNASGITMNCKGKIKQFGGYIWKYN